MFAIAAIGMILMVTVLSFALGWGGKRIMDFVAPDEKSRGGYYVSGLAYCSALAFVPAVILSSRNYGKPTVFGHRAEEMFGYAFWAFLAAFLMFIALSKRTRTAKWNVAVLFALSCVSTIVSVYVMSVHGHVRMDGYYILVHSVVVAGALIVQRFLARAHARYTEGIARDG